MCYFNPLPRKRENLRKKGFVREIIPFQSTPSQEGEHIFLVGVGNDIAFQSTPSQEGEHGGGKMIELYSDFNPLPRKRENTLVGDLTIAEFTFQSTPSQEGEHFTFGKM